MTILRRRHIAALAAALALTAPAVLRADAVERGTVLKIEAGEIYFDVGASTGVKLGAPARIKRPIALRHPVTGKMVEDLLPLGETTVKAVGQSLSVLIPTAELAAQVAPGDVIEVYVVKAVEARERPRVVATPPDEPPAPAIPPEQAELLAVWSATTGKPLDERIAAWETWLGAHPDSRYAATIAEDLKILRDAREKLSSVEPDRTAVEPRVGGLEHSAPSRTEYRQPLGLAFLLRDPHVIRAAWLHYRKKGSETFRRAELRRDGDAYLRGELVAEEVEAPGIEYFVEVATREGTVGAAVGTPAEPVEVDVDAPRVSTLFRERKSRSRVSLRATFMDYGNLDVRDVPEERKRDRQFLFEADFLYRLRTALYGIRVGFGVLNGEGGFITGPAGPPQKNSFTYSYVEAELRPGNRNLAFMLRGVTGLGDEGLGFGAEGRLRLGAEDETNLQFAASTIEDVGFFSEIHLQWAVFRRFPLGFGVALTDQPNNGDLGVRFSTDVAVKALSWFEPTVRISYQGRSKDHSGLGVGLGMVFDW